MNYSSNIVRLSFEDSQNNTLYSSFILSTQNTDIRSNFENIGTKKAVTGKLIPKRGGGVRLTITLAYSSTLQDKAWLNALERCLLVQNSGQGKIFLTFGNKAYDYNVMSEVDDLYEETKTEVVLDESSDFVTSYKDQLIESVKPNVIFKSADLFNNYKKFRDETGTSNDIVIPKFQSIFS